MTNPQIDKFNILITGGAGFIGSNLVEALFKDKRVNKVRVLDNLATGFEKNIEEFYSHKNFEFIKGDIRDYETCLKATEGMDLISHQAALGSVPRSIKDPLTTNAVNITGTLNIFQAAVENKIKRVVFAASSSTYGDSKNLPKVEHIIGKPLSPYAVTKYVNELYADVFSKTYDFEYIGLRYFNVFGPKQDPNGAYAAVIPLFMKAAIENKAPFINGDGSYSRDFTYIDNAVQANILSLFVDSQIRKFANSQINKPAISPVNQIYNVARGEQITINQLWQLIKELAGSSVDPIYRENREGDIPHSLADIEKARDLLDYNPSTSVKTGLQKVFQWYKTNLITEQKLW